MLEARNLDFRWREEAPPLLAGASLRIAAGEIVGLAGASGAGKTTLARILGGYLRAQGGSVDLDGTPLPARGPSPVQLLAQHAELAVNPRWKIGRILAEGGRRDAADLAAFGIAADWLDRHPHELSGGELQRVCILRALVPNLRLLIADEMTARHDAVTQARLWRALLDYARPRGIAILAISHDAALLAAVAARRLHLRDGRLTAG